MVTQSGLFRKLEQVFKLSSTKMEIVEDFCLESLEDAEEDIAVRDGRIGGLKHSLAQAVRDQARPWQGILRIYLFYSNRRSINIHVLDS